MVKRIIAFMLVAAQLSVVSAANYYVDSNNGSDSNKGKGPDKAWKSLDRVNSMTFKAGDVIHFINGGEWFGYFEPKGSGKAGKPIVVKSYGESAKRPKIDGQGRVGKGVIYLSDQSYWEISDLELTNYSDKEGDRRGVWVVANEGAGVLSHIHLKNLHIHHIRGMVGQGRVHKRTSGIIFTSFDDKAECRFDDILVDGCVVHDVSNQGIVTEFIGGGANLYPQSQGWKNVRITNAVITNNLVVNISKNAMIMRNLDGGVVEHNLCHNTAIGHGDGMTGNTIFTATCEGTVFQFNEGYLNRSSAYDGSLYDADLRSPNTIWQYSLSHNNAHGLFWCCTVAEDIGVVCRYNVSYNDKGIIFCANYPVAGLDMHNNTVIIGEERAPIIVSERGRGGSGERVYSFKDNVIYGGERYFTYILAEDKYTRDIDNNHFYGGYYISAPDNRHEEFGDKMMEKGGCNTSPLFKDMGGVGAFVQGDDIPKDFLVMDFMHNFRVAGEHIYSGEELTIESDYKSSGKSIEIKLFDPSGEQIYSKSQPNSECYSLGKICTQRGLYLIEIRDGERQINKKLWVL